MNKEEMKKRGLVFLEDMSLEEEEKMEAERRERSKKRENYDKLEEHDITMEEIDAAINKTIAKKKQQIDKERKR